MRNAPRTLAIVISSLAAAHAAQATEVAVCTDQGRFVIELADVQSPKHVENFLRYVDMAYYSGTVFHRVQSGFVVQGGGFDRELRGRPTLPPVPNESRNGLSNVRGSVSAARTEDPHSATAQFFVNLEDNTPLDAGKDFGYTVFGRIKEGIGVLDQISRLPTGAAGPFKEQVPMPLVAVLSMARLDSEALAALPEGDRTAEGLRERITTVAAAANQRETLQWIQHYRAACGTQDPAIALLEAKAALALEDRQRAVFVLEEYFAGTDEADPTYSEALALYRRAVPENQQSPAQLVDDCQPPAAPGIPDGGAATMADMTAGQARVREFVAAGDAYLACLAKTIDDEKRTAEDRNAAIAEHNRLVSAMEEAASNFNAQIRIFKARQP